MPCGKIASATGCPFAHKSPATPGLCESPDGIGFEYPFRMAATALDEGSATLRTAWPAPLGPPRRGIRSIAGRDDEELPPEHPCIDRVCSRAQQGDRHTRQDKHGDMETAIAPISDWNCQFNEAANDCAVGRKQARDQRKRGQKKDKHDPERSHRRPVCRSIHNQGRSDRNPQEEKRSACRSAREHGEQSLHRCEASPSKDPAQPPMG